MFKGDMERKRKIAIEIKLGKQWKNIMDKRYEVLA